MTDWRTAASPLRRRARPRGQVPQGLHRIAVLALADDGSVFVADTCLGFLVRLTRQAPP
jgi:hypothetical protein